MPKERWRTIIGFENYMISSKGRVYSKRKEIFLKGWICKVGRGYLMVSLGRKSKLTVRYVHRLVAMLFIPNSENKPEVNHKDGNTLNNDIENLEWMTHKENINHAIQSGLMDGVLGSNHPKALLNESQVRLIRKMLAEGSSGNVVAKLFKMSPVEISMIKTRKRWKHVL